MSQFWICIDFVWMVCFTFVLPLHLHIPSWFQLHSEMQWIQTVVQVNGNTLLLAVCGRIKLYLVKRWWWNIVYGLSQCIICSWEFKERSHFSSRDTLCPYLMGGVQFLTTQAHLKNVNLNTIKLSLYGWGGGKWFLCSVKPNFLCLSRCFYWNV